MNHYKDISIEYRDVDSLIPYARNPRKNDEAAQKLAGVIAEFGFQVPVIIRGSGEVIDGHARLKAANILGMKKVPVIVNDEWTETQAKAFRLSVNKSAEWAEWDDELLSLELEDLKLQNFDLSLIDFDTFQIQEPPFEGNTDPDEVPEIQNITISRCGDIWILGNHRLLCGDSTDPASVVLLMDGKLADMWLTDPPYNVAYEGGTGMTIMNDSMEDGKFREFLRGAYHAADSVMRPGAVFYIWHADSEGYNFRGAARDVGWQVRQCLIWEKSSLVLGRQDYQWSHEPCIYGWKDGAAHYWGSDRKQTTVMHFDKPSRSELHPTMKPVALFEYEMLNSSKQGDIVLDSFGGSGTTIIAAEKNGRRAMVMEMDPKYCDVIIRRWQDFTGKEAVLDGDGRTFVQIGDEREGGAA